MQTYVFRESKYNMQNQCMAANSKFSIHSM
jgi:hypothetical protein